VNREDIERLWFEAMRQSTEAGELYIRHRFAALIIAEREAEIAALRHRVRELEHAMRLVGIDHATMLKVAAAIHGRPL
jgi:hypothetical protein